MCAPRRCARFWVLRLSPTCRRLGALHAITMPLSVSLAVLLARRPRTPIRIACSVQVLRSFPHFRWPSSAIALVARPLFVFSGDVPTTKQPPGIRNGRPREQRWRRLRAEVWKRRDDLDAPEHLGRLHVRRSAARDAGGLHRLVRESFLQSRGRVAAATLLGRCLNMVVGKKGFETNAQQAKRKSPLRCGRVRARSS